MSDPITVTSVALPLTKQIIFWFLGKISKKYQLKHFPLKLEKYICELENTPYAFVSSENSIAKLNLNFKFTNYTMYEVSLFSMLGSILIFSEGKGLLEFNMSKLLNLKPEQTGQYWVSISLTNFEANRIVKLFNGDKSKEINIDLELSLATIFGIKNHRISLNRNMEFQNK